MKTRIWHPIVMYCWDWSAFALSGFLAFALRFDGAIPVNYVQPMAVALCIWIAAKFAVFVSFRLNGGSWRYTSAYDAIRVVAANTAASVIACLAIVLLIGSVGVPRSIYVLDWFLSCMFTFGSRLSVRVLVTSSVLHPAEIPQTRTLIYGAGAAGLALLSEIRQNDALPYKIIGLIDDDPAKSRRVFYGKRVLGDGNDLHELVRRHAIEGVLIAIPSATGPEMGRILKVVLKAGVEFKTVPGLADLIQGRELGKQVRDVAVGDLLSRKPVHLELEPIRARVEGKVVMVTGAAGSIGSELCRQIARFHPLALIGFDEAETPLFYLERELEKSFPDLVFHAEIGNIACAEDLEHVMHSRRPSILYHAAAYKHVPMMERHAFAAVQNNIMGTWQVASAAVRHRVEDFVLISTDKAVKPSSVMGATKRVAELVIRAWQQEDGNTTKFVAVRFGNVLASNGSVVPIFKKQLAAGGPLTVTHPEMRRYFMTIPEAAQLVLQAFSYGKGGEVFVLDMGEPVKVVDLARNLILLSGLEPDRDIRIEYSGLRPGEKLFEELNLRDERIVPTPHRQIKIFTSPSGPDLRRMQTLMRELRETMASRDVRHLVLLLKEVIPDYIPSSALLRSAFLEKSNDGEPFAEAAAGNPGADEILVEDAPATRAN